MIGVTPVPAGTKKVTDTETGHCPDCGKRIYRQTFEAPWRPAWKGQWRDSELFTGIICITSLLPHRIVQVVGRDLPCPEKL